MGTAFWVIYLHSLTLINLLFLLILYRGISLCLTMWWDWNEPTRCLVDKSVALVEQERQRENEWERTRDRLREVQLDPNRPTFIEISKAKSQGSNNKNPRLSCTGCPCRLTYTGKSEWAGNKHANIRPNKHTLKRRDDMIQYNTIWYDMIQGASFAADVGHTSKAWRWSLLR